MEAYAQQRKTGAKDTTINTNSTTIATEKEKSQLHLRYMYTHY